MHDLEIRDGQASFFAAREPGWHGLGTVTKGLLTAQEALSAAGLDWDVYKDHVYTRHPKTGEFVVADDRWAIVRDIDGKMLGSVGKHYEPFTNREAFDFLDSLVDDGEAKYATAGALAGGRRVFITLELPEAVEIGGFDPHKTFILLSTSHDGSRAVTVVPTMVRVVCANTESIALAGAKVMWTARHRVGVMSKVHEARETLDLTFQYRDAFSQEMERLLNQEVTDAKFRRLLADVFPAHQKRQFEKNIEGVVRNRHTSPTIDPELQMTAYGALNSYTEWAEHLRPHRTPEAAFKAVTDGWVAEGRSTLAKTLLTV